MNCMCWTPDMPTAVPGVWHALEMMESVSTWAAMISGQNVATGMARSIATGLVIQLVRETSDTLGVSLGVFLWVSLWLSLYDMVIFQLPRGSVAGKKSLQRMISTQAIAREFQ